jgi:Holliday junction resolvase RusA-like endonuclease
MTERPTISFTVPGEAVPWARAGKHGGIQFTPARQRNFMAAVKTLCADAMKGAPPLDCAIELKVIAKYIAPPSWSQRRRDAAAWKRTKPDASNVVKIIEDALNKVAWVDDAQIASLHVWKRYSYRAELVVEIRGLE